MPYWPKGITKTVGSFQVVEMPYVGTNALIEIIKPPLQKREAKIQAESVLKHILFIKNTSGLVIPKVVHIVPDFEYLKINNFDISFNYVSNLDKNFSGWLMIYSWQNELEKAIYLQNGLTKKILLNVKKETVESQQSTLEELSSNSFGQLVCMPDYDVSAWLSNCSANQSGDVPNPENCAVTIFVSEGGTNCFIEPNEDGEFDDWEEDDCIATGDPNCFCEMLGICDFPPGDGDGSVELIDSLKIDLTEPCFINTINNLSINNGLRSQLGSILTSCFPNWSPNDFTIEQKCYSDTLLDGKHYASDNPGSSIIIKLNECGISNASQEYVAATLFHELLHAFFTAQGKMTELQQHESIATAYADALRSTLKDYFPGLSDNEALALAWGGLEGTTAWQNKVQGDPALVNTYKTLSNNHRWGNSGTNCK